ncbi:serine/threonine-protein kinase [Luteolibacter yonseiensis]|uniref:serine/threonine protein kinase n=1 Tax=Luteolibacter yonseiensis TaxID=1144680 RepID=UPI002D808CB1|nr:serine/threonine-protein kinase [Luteolibacter yonseiensis]
MECAILEVALSLDEEARREFLTRTFQNDAEGLSEMRILVDATRGATSFFLDARERRARMASDIISEMAPSDTSAASPLDALIEGPGAKLGRYRLVKRIGEGGGGVVYEAEQEEPIRRRVAIKIVRLGMNTESVIARFEIERQALALMDHPNIAKVLDAGAASSGRPYFVMELVTGEKITSYCDSKKLGTVQRLHLFIKVCHAIQHAHQKGIIHRDIKPSNILVADHDGLDEPKVIDFGIAKAIESQAFGEKPFTSHDQFFGTPAYMSPEQIDLAGLDVDTRSDIYSLGVLLYELLTSRTPLDGDLLATQGISKIRDTLLNTEIQRPSLMLGEVGRDVLQTVAKDRKAEPTQLVSFIRGDLDWIVLRAMDKNRARRYQTVNSLARDVQRFLEHQPVTARPPGRLYLLEKFIRRNRLAVSAGIALAASLVAGLVISTGLYKRERQALREQLRLREEAQAARAVESRLREEADARANVARVAFLLDQGRIDEADTLRQKYPLSSIEPSLEAASVFRALGDWNATHGRWDQAIQCFKLLMQANLLDEPSNVLQRSDFLAISSALLYHEKEEYLAFRREVKERYLTPRNTLQAEHLLKICLLSPADHDLLKRLRHTVEVMGEPTLTSLPSWSGFALGLYHYREGAHEAALRVCETGLADPRIKNSCRASILTLLSMIHSRMGGVAKADETLAEARKLITESEGNDAVQGSSVPPYWFDWVIAELLVKEAEQEIAKR